MAKTEFLKGAVAAIALAFSVGAADAATYSYVGNWEVYNAAAPTWYGEPPNGPLAYTAQEAAALLFGGSATDYVISTLGDMVDDINFTAWYDVIGYGGAQFAQDYDNKYLGQFYGPTSGYDFGNPNTYASAFVRDNLNGAGAINYAFRISTVPLPAGGLLLISALGGVAVLRRRKQAI